MATPAILAELAVVNVVNAVANTTRGRKLDLAFYRSPVAGNTLESNVFAVQREARLGVVIEFPQVPSVRVMAGIAVWPQSAPMGIFIRMAIATSTGRFLKLLRQMTRFARNDRMQADEWKICQVVIKLDAGSP